MIDVSLKGVRCRAAQEILDIDGTIGAASEGTIVYELEGEGGQLPAKPFGQDILELPGYERYGFLELKRPGERWPAGSYVIKLYIAPHGQQSFHAVNQVGTLRFTIADTMPLPPLPAR